MTVTSADLSTGTFPRDLTCDGVNRKPTVSLASIPAGTQSIALELLDPDAPSGNFTQWLVFADGRVGPSVPAFPPAGAVEGKNDAGGIGYSGPCPPPGAPHHYHLMAFALGFALGPGGANLAGGYDIGQLDATLGSNRGPVLARGDLVATYSRA